MVNLIKISFQADNISNNNSIQSKVSWLKLSSHPSIIPASSQKYVSRSSHPFRVLVCGGGKGVCETQWFIHLNRLLSELAQWKTTVSQSLSPVPIAILLWMLTSTVQWAILHAIYIRRILCTYMGGVRIHSACYLQQDGRIAFYFRGWYECLILNLSAR